MTKDGGRWFQCFCTVLPFSRKRGKRGKRGKVLGRYLRYSLAILGAEARGKQHEESSLQDAPGLEKFARRSA